MVTTGKTRETGKPELMPVVDVYSVSQFRDIVSEPTLTVACFTAVWCGPCKTMEKDLEKLVHEFPGVCFARIDADNNSEIVSKCRVLQLPTFMIVRGGEMLSYVIGADTASLKKSIRTHQVPHHR